MLTSFVYHNQCVDVKDGMDTEEQPSSHRLATSLGVDARNMQVMKASFFEDEDMPAPAFGELFHCSSVMNSCANSVK